MTTLALPLLNLRYPWPPLLLALLTLLALALAYSVRPAVRVELGDYYDSAYLQNFHAREVVASGAAQQWDWPGDSNQITLPGGRAGDWIANVRAHEHLPGRPVSGVALRVNGEPVNIPNDYSHEFRAIIPAELAAADQLVLQVYGTPMGAPDPEVGTIAEVELAPARTYRWTRGESSILLPGLGRGTWRLDLSTIVTHPDGQPVNAQVFVNDTLLATLPEHNSLRRLSLLVPADMMRGGDMHISLRSNVYEDPRPLGIAIAGFGVSPAGGESNLLPPWKTALYSLVSVLGLYACLAVLAGMPTPQMPHRRHPLRLWLAALLPLAAALLLAWALANHRFPTSFMLPGLAGLALWSLLLLLVLRPLLRWAAGGGGQGMVAGRLLFVDALLLVFFIGYWIKAAGMLYPYFIGIDIHWHMERVRWILGGQLPLLYGTDSPLNESTMPVAEWGENRPVIPYSPYFHMFATLFAALPWPLEFSANMFSALLDSSRMLLIGLLAVRVGLSQRAALLAALLYTVLPINFLLLSWGNIPTTFGLWWVLGATVFALACWPRLHKRGMFLVLALLLLASLLFYTVAGAFMGLFLLCFTLALWLAAQRSSTGKALLPGLRPLWLATAAALGVSLLIYYGQYIPPIIEQTIPYFVEALVGEGHEDAGRVSDTLSAYLLRHGRLAHYGLVVPLLLTAVYLVWAWVARFRLTPPTSSATDAPAQPGGVLLWAMVAGWVAVMLVFVPLGYRISMVDKHFLAAIPAMMLASAIVLDRLWRFGWPVWVFTLLWYGYLGAAAVQLWLTRIAIVQQVYE
jgi:hypothetical protein